PVVSFAGPELCIRLALENIARPDEGFSQAKLVVAKAVIEICEAGRVRGVGLKHDLRFQPCLVGIPLWIHPVIDKNELAIRFSLVSQPVFCACARSLECDLLSTLAV